jgi:hypothetical protein
MDFSTYFLTNIMAIRPTKEIFFQGIYIKFFLLISKLWPRNQLGLATIRPNSILTGSSDKIRYFHRKKFATIRFARKGRLTLKCEISNLGKGKSYFVNYKFHGKNPWKKIPWKINFLECGSLEWISLEKDFLAMSYYQTLHC